MHLSLNASLGAMLIGVILSSCMYGVTTLQTYIYFAHASGDRKLLKYLILILWLLNTLRMAFVSNAAYTYTVTDFTDLALIVKPTWTVFPAAVITVGVSNTIVRGILLHRVWRLSEKNRLLAAAVLMTIVFSLGGNLAFASVGIRCQTWTSLENYSWLLIFSFSWNMLADVLLSASVCVLLAMRKTGHTRSDNVVRAISMSSVNAGVLSCVCALVCLVSFVTMPDNFVFMTSYMVYPELVLNCLLATLNRRPYLRKTMNTPTTTNAQLLRSAAMDAGSRIDRCDEVLHIRGVHVGLDQLDSRSSEADIERAAIREVHYS